MMDPREKLPYPKLDEATKKLNGASSRNLHQKIRHLLEVFDEDAAVKTQALSSEDEVVLQKLDDERESN